MFVFDAGGVVQSHFRYTVDARHTLRCTRYTGNILASAKSKANARIRGEFHLSDVRVAMRTPSIERHFKADLRERVIIIIIISIIIIMISSKNVYGRW